MNKTDLLKILSKKKKSELLNLLEEAFSELGSNERERVFGDLISEKIQNTKLKKPDTNRLTKDISKFYQDSIKRRYYAPFDINSKNFRHLPEETNEWCNKFSFHLEQTIETTKQGFHEQASECFKMLFDLLEKLCYGHEIIFGDEIGPWMIHMNEEDAMQHYVISLSKCATKENFANEIILLLKSGWYDNPFPKKTYKKACASGSKEQVSHLKKEIKRLDVIVS